MTSRTARTNIEVLAARWLSAGLVEPPPRMVEAVIDWVDANIYGGDEETILPTDLRGWKHLGDRDYLPFDPKATTFLVGGTSLRVVLRESRGAGGTFNRRTHPAPTISINPVALSRVEYDKRDRYLRAVVEHELRHWAQFLLQGGLPSKKIRTPAISQHVPPLQQRSEALWRQLRQLGVPTTKDMFHALDDIEFYTRLADAIGDFKVLARGLQGDDRTLAVHYFTGSKPTPTKYVLTEKYEREALDDHGPFSEAVARRQVQQKVHERLTTFKKFRRPHKFFASLLGAKGKWRKAVGEFTVAVSGQASVARVANAFLQASDVLNATNSVGGEPWQRVRLPGLGQVTTEPHDTEDTFPPVIASYEIIDGWLVAHGRNGSVAVVVGSQTELQQWARQVSVAHKADPLREGPRPWTPEDGGERYVREATKVAERVLRALGVSAKIEVYTMERSDARGDASGSTLTLYNVHKKPRPTSFIDGIKLPVHIQIAAHEAAHLGFDRGGRPVLQAIKEHVRAGGDYLSIYHSVAGDFEGVMEAAALYALAPEQFKKAAPVVYEAVHKWFKGKKIASEPLDLAGRVASRWL